MKEKFFIEQGLRKIELENYMKQELSRAGFVGLDIVKTPLVTRIVLRVTKPGLAIGKGGQSIRQLTEGVGKRFGIENPQIEIQDVPDAALNARAIVDKMAMLLARGYSWRSVAFRTVRDIMGAKAQGVELILSGKLAGKGGRKRKQRIAEGYMKKVGNQAKLVDYAKASAYPKAGAIGIKLRVIKPGVEFPDKFDIKEKFKKMAEAEEAARAAEAEIAAGAAKEGEKKETMEKAAGGAEPEIVAGAKAVGKKEIAGGIAAAGKAAAVEEKKTAEGKKEKVVWKKKTAGKKPEKAKRKAEKKSSAGKKKTHSSGKKE